MIVGNVESKQTPLISDYNKTVQGPIRVYEVKEHGMQWRNELSSSTVRTLIYDVNSIPFNLKNKSGSIQNYVEIESPLSASYLLDSLTTTHTEYEQAKGGSVGKLISELIVREKVKGVEKVERMLLEGTQLTAFGRIEKVNARFESLLGGRFKLSAPTNQEFIITNLSRTDLIAKLEDDTRFMRNVLIVFGLIGVGATAGVAIYYGRKYLERRRAREQADAMRRDRERRRQERQNRTDPAAETTNGQIDSASSSTCVVCLSNPREIILLDCGHVCLCVDCLEQIRDRKCPICRAVFRSHMPFYVS